MIDFREFALCRGSDPELFFAVGAPGAPAYDLQVAEAKAVCVRCPVREACLAWALDTHQEFGVLGGLDEHERAALLRRPARVSVA